MYMYQQRANIPLQAQDGTVGAILGSHYQIGAIH